MDFNMKLILNILFIICISSCKAQVIVDDISFKIDLNYYLANIYIDEIEKHTLYDGGLIITYFPFAHTENNLKKDIDHGHEVQTGILLSVSPDGEYVKSFLFNLGPFILPKVVSINQTHYPNFILKVECGISINRKIETIEIKVPF